MAKLTLTDVVQGFQSAPAINANNDAIETALENTMSRDGTTPNTMSSDIDMGTNKIQNLEAPAASNDAARWVDVTDAVDITGLAAPAQTGNANKVLVTDGSLTSWDDADGIKYNAQGNIVATNIGDAIDELDSEKAGLTLDNTISGNNTFTVAQTFQSPINYLALTGTGTYTATLVPAIDSYQTGVVYYLSTANANPTTTPTINLNGLGAKTVVNIIGGALSIGELNGFHLFQYDGTNMRLLNPATGSSAAGTWTPTVQDDTLSDSESQTYTTQYGTYTKIGNRVLFSGEITVSSLGTLTTTQTVRIAGLPFTAATGDNQGSVAIGRATGLSLDFSGRAVTGVILSNTNYITLHETDTSNGTSELIFSDFSASGSLTFFGQYIV